MTFDHALHLTAALMALAFIQQSLEHLGPATRLRERLLFLPRLSLSVLLLMAPRMGLNPAWLALGLVVNHLAILPFFNGPYNGGADRMSLLILLCLTGALTLPDQHWRELALGYLAMQVVLSYAISGWVKIVNPAWRQGRALRDVFAFSAYPAGKNIRLWANRPGLLRAMSWAVMGFELSFPLTMLSRPLLIAALVVAALFHMANACLFGLNRFVWIWICAYPSLLWLQHRITE